MGNDESKARYDLLVIGAGPGGYVAAIRAAQLGLRTACVEKEERLGGTCLRVGCIPSKALLESSEMYHLAKSELSQHGVRVEAASLDLETMLARKDSTVDGLTKGIAGLFKKNKIERFSGTATFEAPGRVRVAREDGSSEVVEAERVLIATGSKVASLKGVEIDGEHVVTSTEALSFERVPKHLVVIGAGAIGLDLGSVWARLGAKVTVLEYADRILVGMDTEIAKETQKILAKQGLAFTLGARVTGARYTGRACVVETEGSSPIECDKVLCAVGRVPNTDGLGLDEIGVGRDARGRIEVDAHFRTSVEGVYAVGDVIAGPMLAHKAEEEGVACVEGIVTGHGHVDYAAIPAIVYTNPEVASVGATEEQLQEDGVPYRKGSFPFMANGRARALAQTAGKVKLLAHAETDRLLGAHIVGPRAGDLIAELAVAIEFGASSEDVARACHAHPTLAECVKEAALAVDGRALHV
ncbi:MAG: dihydrolipoyl dehydrogenase [Planctomycetota bacterium]